MSGGLPDPNLNGMDFNPLKVFPINNNFDILSCNDSDALDDIITVKHRQLRTNRITFQRHNHT